MELFTSPLEHNSSRRETGPTVRELADNIEHAHTQEELLQGWKEFTAYLSQLGFEEKDTNAYLSSLMLNHGSEIVVRRGALASVFESLEKKVQVSVNPIDTEPNAALLGNGKGEETGIGVALTGGFGWFVENKIAGVYGFLPNPTQLRVSDLTKDSLSHTKKGAELMKRIDGVIAPEDFLFFLTRTHKSAFPEALLTDEDYDETTGEVNPFILRVYGKSRPAH